MKKTLSLFMLFILIFSMYSCTVLQDENCSSEAPNTADPSDTVMISNAEIYADYAVLPFCDTITALGFHLTWFDNDHATFVCNEIEYQISISEKTLTKVGDDENYLICAPGNQHFVCEVKKGILMVDDLTVKCLFQSCLDYPMRISIDHAENVHDGSADGDIQHQIGDAFVLMAVTEPLKITSEILQEDDLLYC